MKTSEVFRKAKEILPHDLSWDVGWDAPSPYICDCIRNSVIGPEWELPYERHPEWESVLEAQWVIRQRMDNEFGMEQWLRKHGVPKGEINQKRLQAHRHAWLDLLIKEFEAKGD
jgi:hypothetical protein